MANRLLSAQKKKQAPVAPATQHASIQSNENAGESGWMHPENQVIPPAKNGGPMRKMHAPGMRMRGKC